MTHFSWFSNDSSRIAFSIICTDPGQTSRIQKGWVFFWTLKNGMDPFVWKIFWPRSNQMTHGRIAFLNFLYLWLCFYTCWWVSEFPCVSQLCACLFSFLLENYMASVQNKGNLRPSFQGSQMFWIDNHGLFLASYN